MKQGSNMTVSHRGMRRGISLMEMMVAVIMLGILSSVGYNYYKNYFDTSLAAKQIKVAVLIEQASQLKNALELYRTKFGIDANTTQGLQVLADQRIITEVPTTIPDISSTGWVLETDVQDINSTLISAQGGTTSNEQLITYDVDQGTVVDKMQYCNALNNIASNGVTDFTVLEAGLDVDLTDSIITSDTGALEIENTFFCWDSNATANTGIQFVFITKIY